MKLIEALEIVREEPREAGQALSVGLVCGFSPLHIQTFLAAQLRLLLRDRRAEIIPGLYGDFWGNMERLESAASDAGMILMEWGDLDPRLGFRSLGSWAPGVFPDIVANVRSRAGQFREIVQRVGHRMPLAVSFPTLPLPPVSYSPGWQANALELEIRAMVSSLSLDVAGIVNVKVINPQQVDRLSPLADRFDAKSEVLSGFPYKVPHASVLAELLSRLICPPSPKKGLISDLDDTLWSGILGEVGVPNVSWDLEHHSHLHGAYQRMLQSLSESGVFIAVASKNEPQVVAEALQRKDLILSANAVFPVEVHWGPKSESVGRILKAWNIGPDSVVFVDDSPMELAEVKAVYPDMECILFPKGDYPSGDELFRRLRDLFGKGTISEEDSLRRESVRQAYIRNDQGAGQSGMPEDFLERAEAEITLSYAKTPPDPRALELVNKTNQFNLNGKRYTDASWQAYLKAPESVLMVAAYRDKYGPLGKIAVLAGQKQNASLRLDVWVMSCRAFGRRIEYGCMEQLFERLGVEEVVFDFQSTAKNGPIREALEQMLGAAPAPDCRLSKDQFREHRLKTFHRVSEVSCG